MNEAKTIRIEPVGEMPQRLKEAVNPCESDEQREQRGRFEILQKWDIGIQVLNRGCVVKVGCKSIAFTSIEAAYKEIGRYLENPLLVANEYGFLNPI